MLELPLDKLQEMAKAAREAQPQEKAKGDSKSYGIVSDFNRSGISTAELDRSPTTAITSALSSS